MIKRISLGSGGPKVSRFSLGTADFGAATSQEAADAVLDAYLGLGGNFIDTAHVYAAWIPNGAGASERCLGDYLRRRGVRDQLVLATKGGHPDFQPNYPRPDHYLAPEVIAGDITDSLERLQIDCIDLYYLHRDDPRVPVDEVISMLNEEIHHGRIRHIGASNWCVDRVAAANEYAAANELHGFCASQVEFSLASAGTVPDTDPAMRTFTPEMNRWHQESKLPVVAYSAAANGFFAQSANAERKYGNHTNQWRRKRVEELARTRGCSPTALALAWLLHQPFPVIPLIATSRPERLQQITEADALELDETEVNALRGGADGVEAGAD